eukprot:TRINITY_DN8659_c0_g1_i2.p1 TRINITY_DN8659_c0_g1~~TRINITY_DN8659_c0_g1_i2.p1  ORF type:complete len:431 (+),score=174.63 TRINITY_DN8659_c0_g1_i2:273-1565(+)
MKEAPAPQSTADGRRTYRIQGTTYVVDERYELMCQIGKGSYSFVCKAKDTVSGRLVAVKKIFDVFDDLVDARRILREVVLLRYLRHPNVTCLLQIMRPWHRVREFRDLYLVLEYMDTDMHQLVRSRQQLTEEHRQWFTFQILRALAFMHKKRVIHRDIKPGNLLLTNQGHLKVCDFGLARGGVEALSAHGLDLTDYVVTRWYRPPEMLLMANYAGGIDLWSTGCVVAELVTRRALFPGRDYIHQLNLITDLVGVPEPDDVAFATSAEARQFVRNMKRKDVGGALQTKLAAAKPACFDLITKLLVFNPYKRLSAAAALHHPYIAEHLGELDSADEVPPGDEPDWGFDHREVNEEALRGALWQEMERSQEGPLGMSPPTAAASPKAGGLMGMAVALIQRVGRGLAGRAEASPRTPSGAAPAAGAARAAAPAR